MEQEISRESIMKMEPGREMDALVVEKVMGWTEIDMTKTRWRTEMGQPADERRLFAAIPDYSTDIAAAWEVVEKIRESGGMQLGCYKEEFEFEVILVRDEFETTIYGKTAPEVICKAALYLALEDKSHD